MRSKQQGLTFSPDSKSLPNGWRTMRFDQIAECINDRVDNPSESGVERYVGLEHLDPESLKIRRWGSPDQVESTKLRFKPGDIIFGKRRAYQRKLAVADFEGICSAHAMVLRACEETVLKDFLPFFLQSDTFFERAIAISVGSLSPTINWKTLAEQEFALPPKDEQKWIADILWAADESLVQYELCIAQADQVRKLLLNKLALTGISHTEFRYTEIGYIPTDWGLKRIGEVGLVQLGRQRSPIYQSGKYSHPYLRVANVFDDYIELNDVLEMDFDESDFEKYLLKSGDILLNEGQSRELVGRSCIFRGEIEGCCFQNTLVRFRAFDEILPEYAQGYFQHAFYKGAFAAIARQTTSIAHLGADRFANLLIPVPPLSEQQEIVKHLNSTRQSYNELISHKKVLSHLKKSIINKELSFY